MPKTNRPNNISLFSALEILGLKDLAETNPALIHGFVFDNSTSSYTRRFLRGSLNLYSNRPFGFVEIMLLIDSVKAF